MELVSFIREHNQQVVSFRRRKLLENGLRHLKQGMRRIDVSQTIE